MNPDPHDPELDELALLVLHDQADDNQRAQLSALLGRSEENRRRFLDHSLLHSQLAHSAKAGAMSSDPQAFFRSLESTPFPFRFRVLRIGLAAAAIILACLIAIPFLPTTASAALDKVIDLTRREPDRCYRIQVLEPNDLDGSEPRPDRGRYPVPNHLDGATLWLRSPGRFVIRQSLPNGETRFIGSDGDESWSQRGQGTARTSDDPERFGGGLLGKRKDLAFLDLNHQLDELKSLYQIEWLDRTNPDLRKLRAIRRSADQGGPREIELWFTPDSGLLKRMILRQLPRGNGGPRSIALDLIDTSPLPDGFFKSTHPHPAAP